MRGNGGGPVRTSVRAAVVVAVLIVLATVAPAEPAGAAPRARASLSVEGAVFGKPATVRVTVRGGAPRSISLRISGSPLTYNLVSDADGWQVPWPGIGKRSVVATVTLRNGRTLHARQDVMVEPARSGGFQMVFVYSSGHDLPGQAEALAHVAHEVRYWYSRQMGGPAPMFVNDADGMPSVVRIEIPTPPEQVAQSDVVGSSLAAWFADGTIPPGTTPVVFLNGREPGPYCGVSHYEPRYVVIPMANCMIAASLTDRFPYGATYIIAHEIAHELGAVSDAAPHHNGTGHIADNPADLLYFGAGPRDYAHLALDPGHDDYYLTGRSDLTNIETSPLLDSN